MIPKKLISPRFFHKVPKAELHCHLDGSLRESTLLALSKKESIEPEIELYGRAHLSLEKYLERFAVICSVMQTKENIQRAAFELVEDSALENCWHIEYRFCPSLLTLRGLSLNQVTSAALLGASQAAKKYGISSGLILCGMRSDSPEKSLEIAQVAARYASSGVVGFDLAGPEKGYPARDHQKAFDFARKSGLKITVHAGEGYGPGSIDQALRFAQASRIGHGTRLIESPRLLEHVVEQSIPLEVCLTSNEQTSVVRRVSEHPLPVYMLKGVIVTLNTDNRLVSKTTLTREYERAHYELGLGYGAIKKIVINGFENAFLPANEKKSLVAKVHKRLGELEEEFGF